MTPVCGFRSFQRSSGGPDAVERLIRLLKGEQKRNSVPGNFCVAPIQYIRVSSAEAEVHAPLQTHPFSAAHLEIGDDFVCHASF